MKIELSKWRMTFVKVIFLIICFILLWRLSVLQIARGDYYSDLSLRQAGAGNIDTERGNIYFQNKNGELVPAAINKKNFLLAVNPKLIEDYSNNPTSDSTAEAPKKNTLYEKLSQIVQLDYDDFITKIAKKDDPFEILVQHLDKETALKITSFQNEYKGLILAPEKWRFYPANNLGSHLLGFVGYDGAQLKGRYGLENFYDSYLAGEKTVNKKPFLTSLLDLGQRVFANYEASGSSIILTVEPVLQGVLESHLEKIFQKYDGLKAGGVIIDPRNGKILAMAVKPDFNPNEYWKVKDVSIFNNPLVENIFEVGSVFKPLTLGAAIDQSAIAPETEYYDKGYVVFNNKMIENYDGKARGKVDMQTVLNKSLNTGAVFAMEALGKEKFKSYIINYGLAEKTGIDLPGEVRGKTDNLNSMRDIEFATASFGQGIAVSPIEFIAAFSALVNGGNVIQPYLVEKIIPSEDLSAKEPSSIFELKEFGAVKRKVLKNETSETINRMLTEVVDEALLEGGVKMEHYAVAAKTGTAQKIKSDAAGYSDDYLHTFIGYFPSFDPRFLIFLFLERPVGARYAAYTLTPPFMDIVKFIINYYELPPDR